MALKALPMSIKYGEKDNTGTMMRIMISRI